MYIFFSPQQALHAYLSTALAREGDILLLHGRLWKVSGGLHDEFHLQAALNEMYAKTTATRSPQCCKTEMVATDDRVQGAQVIGRAKAIIHRWLKARGSGSSHESDKDREFAI